MWWNGFNLKAGAFIHRLQKRSLWFLLPFLIVLAVMLGRMALVKPLWFDELFTLKVSSLPRFADVLDVLGRGAEPNPPLNYLAVRGSLALVSNEELAVRLPPLAGFLIMEACLFFVLLRSGTVTGAILGVLIPVVADSLRFAVEARPYGMVLGWCGLVVFFYQRAAGTSEARMGWLIGLAASVAGAVSSHYYAATIVLPLAFAELVRAIERRHVDGPPAAAVLLGLTPLIFYYPMIHRAQAVLQSGFFNRPRLEDLSPFYASLMSFGTLALVFALMVILLGLCGRPKSAAPDDSAGPPLYEVALAAGFLLLPPAAILAATRGFGVFSGRYLVFVVIGLALLGGFLLNQAARRIPAASLGVILVFLAVAAGKSLVMYREYDSQRDYVKAALGQIDKVAAEHGGVVISNPVSYLQFDYYADRYLKDRLHYLASPEKSRHYLNQDTSDRALSVMKAEVAPRLDSFEEYVRAHRQFVVFRNEGWLRAALEDEGATLTLLKGDWIRVDLPNAQAGK